MSVSQTMFVQARGVLRRHTPDQQNYLSVYLYADRRPEVGVVYTGSHVKSSKRIF
uniref:Uncharacterized protein n=1 Tax=Anguilla anguilla TaxID=7936 RepID=A0A0E9XFN8_ANGAN